MSTGLSIQRVNSFESSGLNCNQTLVIVEKWTDVRTGCMLLQLRQSQTPRINVYALFSEMDVERWS